VPIVYKDGRKFEKWRKALGDGTYGDPHIPYTKLDGTLEADIAAIKDSVEDPVDMITGQLVMTGVAMPLSETSQVVHTLVLVPLWGDIYLGGSTVTDETGMVVPESMTLKNKDMADLYVIGNEGDVLTWTAW
jgi:hypothetical protein